MNEVTKQAVLDLLQAAKAHIEASENAQAIEKIEAAIVTIENEGIETTAADPGNPPLPGEGANGPG